MKKLACLIMVAMLVITGVCPIFAMESAVAEDIVPESDVMPRVSYQGPMTTYVEQLEVVPGVIEGGNAKFNYSKLTVSVGAVDSADATVSTSQITVRINRYLPGGTYVTVATATVPVDGEPHNVVTGLAISTSAVYMISYSIPAYYGARVDVTTCAHSYTS